MSSRDFLWFIAGSLITLALTLTALVWLPWFSPKPVDTERSESAPESSTGFNPTATSVLSTPPRSAMPVVAIPLIAALCLIAVALGIYFLLGSPESIATEEGVTTASNMTPSHAAKASSASAGSLDDVTGKLAARLAKEGGSDDDWRLLAQSYEYMGRNDDAQAALKHVINSSTRDAASTGASQLLSPAEAMRLEAKP